MSAGEPGESSVAAGHAETAGRGAGQGESPGRDEAAEPPAILRRAVVVTCSTRAADGVYPDRGGPIIVDALREWGFQVSDPTVVPDGPNVGEVLRAALATGADLVVTTGGTGLSPTDGTPEATRGVLDREVPGIAEAIRAAGLAKGVPTAMLSRGVAGVAGRALIVNLPGSPGGVKDALEVLSSVVHHALSQIRGGDH